MDWINWANRVDIIDECKSRKRKYQFGYDRSNVLRDEEIRFTGYDASHKYPHTLRRIVVWDDENQREIVLLTNHMEFAASTIGRIYKDRWQIES